MIEIISYDESIKKAESIRNGESKDRVLMVIFTLSTCEVCEPWMKEVIQPLSNVYDNEIEFVQVLVDKNRMLYPPPQVPCVYFFVPGRPEEEHISRLGPASPEFVQRDLIKLIKMKNEGLSLYDAFYAPIS